jgi:hypothetical protein
MASRKPATRKRNVDLNQAKLSELESRDGPCAGVPDEYQYGDSRDDEEFFRRRSSKVSGSENLRHTRSLECRIRT